MEYKVRKFQTPSGTLQYFANLNAEARGKNNSPEERVKKAFGTQRDQQRHDTPGLRTDRNGVVSVDYENQGNYVPTVTHRVGTALKDTGTQLLYGVQTLGSSIVGDAVKGFSPKAANWLDKNTFGIITTTPEERLQRNRQGNNRWQNRVTDAANAVSMAAAMPVVGKGINVVGRKSSQLVSKNINKVKLNRELKNSLFNNPSPSLYKTKTNTVPYQSAKTPSTHTDFYKVKNHIDLENRWVTSLKKNNPYYTAEDIATIKKHVPEYAQIENMAKKQGTWMKNMDGTPFKGEPEEFIMEQSKAFKKAFPTGSQSVYRGTGVGYDPSFSDKGYAIHKDVKFGSAVYTSPDINVAGFHNSKGGQQKILKLRHRNSDNNFKYVGLEDNWGNLGINRSYKDLKNMYSLRKNTLKELNKIDLSKPTHIDSWGTKHYKGNKTTGIVDQTEHSIAETKKTISDWFNNYKIYKNNKMSLTESQKEAHKKIQSIADNHNRPNNITTNDVAKFVERENLDNAILDQIKDPLMGSVHIVNHKPGNYLKSLLGNNGDFNMGNSNIYKSILGAIGLGSLGANEINK